MQAARHANPHCYVVIVTGYASLDSAIHAVRVGAYDYLTVSAKLFEQMLLDCTEEMKRVKTSGG